MRTLQMIDDIDSRILRKGMVLAFLSSELMTLFRAEVSSAKRRQGLVIETRHYSPDLVVRANI